MKNKSITNKIDYKLFQTLIFKLKIINKFPIKINCNVFYINVFGIIQPSLSAKFIKFEFKLEIKNNFNSEPNRMNSS